MGLQQNKAILELIVQQHCQSFGHYFWVWSVFGYSEDRCSHNHLFLWGNQTTLNRNIVLYGGVQAEL